MTFAHSLTSSSRLFLAVVAVAGLIAAPPLQADDGGALLWLMHEPVTLLDIGIFRLRQDVSQTAEWLLASWAVDGHPVSGAFYDWNSRRIVACVTVPATGLAEPTTEACRATFATSVRH